MPTFAAIDIGSNSVRLKVARLTGRRLVEIHEDRAVTRLGESVFRDGYLSPESMADTLKVLRRFHRSIQKLGVDQVRLVATSASRDARNSAIFLEWIRSATGWNAEIISGQEEARLIHLGLVSNLRLRKAPVLMIDLGGGSCELTISTGGHIKESVSLPLGAVRLTNEFLRHDPPRKGELERLRGFITRYASRNAERVAKFRPTTVIATSGTAAALADLSEGMYDTPKGVVTQNSARRMAKLLSRLPIDERRRLPGIGPRRAEIILPGALVYSEILERCHLKSFRYSPLGLRDGLLALMAAEYDHRTRSGRQIESERWDSVLAAVSHYRADKEHSLRVREFALTLFDKLRGVHHLPEEYREYLGVAAMLYEVGDYVNRNGRHRHTHYIIVNSEILGYTPEQRRAIGAIARYMGNSRPAATDMPMKLLTAPERKCLPAAVALLRLARGMNLGRNKSVRDFQVKFQDAQVKLALKPQRGTGVDLELWAIEKERSYFREVFGRTLSAAAA